MKLYEIDRKIAEIFENMTVDEVTGEVSLDAEALAELQMARVDKLEGAALYVKDLEAMAKAIREEETALAKRRKAFENKASRIKVWLAESLQDERLETPRVKVFVAKPAQVAKADDVYEIMKWMNGKHAEWERGELELDEILRIRDTLDIKTADPTVSLTGLKKLINEFGEIPGAHLEDGKLSLRIK